MWLSHTASKLTAFARTCLLFITVDSYVQTETKLLSANDSFFVNVTSKLIMIQLYALVAFSLSMATFATSEGRLPPSRLLPQRDSHWTVGQTVYTESGPVTGRAASNASEVSTYLAIPYAQPPTGDLRFASPQKFKGKATINGTKFVSRSFQPMTNVR